jgi:hypothetical protein
MRPASATRPSGLGLLAFGPTNVGIWRMCVAAELGEHGEVIGLAREFRPDAIRL